MLNLKTTVDVMPYYLEEKNIATFTKHRVLTKEEIHSRYEILVENYIKVIHIEALTMLELAKKNILPAVSAYAKELAETIALKRQISAAINCKSEEGLLITLSDMCADFVDKQKALEESLAKAKNFEDEQIVAEHYKDHVIPAMVALRAVADAMEEQVSEKYWPFPTYGELLFSVL
ncbi:MAG TPA: hypothetical protein DDW34_09335 [Clostridium sp.]|nr:hypothetical protein [Clostridium sp.]